MFLCRCLLVVLFACDECRGYAAICFLLFCLVLFFVCAYSLCCCLI